jgi:hypothetical protein
MPTITLQDPAELKAFAAKVRDIADYITAHQKQLATRIGIPPVRFGQDATTTQVPADLARKFQESMAQIDTDVQTLVAKLNLIADAADTISKNYSTAAALEWLSVSEVQSQLGVGA